MFQQFGLAAFVVGLEQQKEDHCCLLCKQPPLPALLHIAGWQKDNPSRIGAARNSNSNSNININSSRDVATQPYTMMERTTNNVITAKPTRYLPQQQGCSAKGGPTLDEFRAIMTEFCPRWKVRQRREKLAPWSCRDASLRYSKGTNDWGHISAGLFQE